MAGYYLPKTAYRGETIKWPAQQFTMEGEPADFAGYTDSVLQVIDADGDVVATGTVTFSESDDGDLDTATSEVAASESTDLVEGGAYTYREVAQSGVVVHVLRHGPLYITGASSA